VPYKQFLQPVIDAEIALTLGADVRGPGISELAVRNATSHVRPAIEIADVRFSADANYLDYVADNAGAAAVVYGEFDCVLNGVDLEAEDVWLYRDAELIGSGRGYSAFGGPLKSVAWLANKLAAFGLALHEGETILTGALIPPVPAGPGETFTTKFGTLGTVEVAFSDEAAINQVEGA
jgi:2-keto-4-pentenoate hydratase